MPYIPPKDRESLDPLIDDLAARMAAAAKGADNELALAGLLNYACTRLALSAIRLRFPRMRYGLIALVSGVFHNVGDEFYRRVATAYEDQQMRRNGDVDVVEKMLVEIGEMA